MALSKHLVAASAEDVPDILRASLREGSELDLLSTASWLLAVHSTDRAEYFRCLSKNPEDAAGAALSAFVTLLPDSPERDGLISALGDRRDAVPSWVFHLDAVSVTGQLYRIFSEAGEGRHLVIGLRLIDASLRTLVISRDDVDGPILDVQVVDQPANQVAESVAADVGLKDPVRVKVDEMIRVLDDALARTMGMGVETPTWPAHAFLLLWVSRLMKGDAD